MVCIYRTNINNFWTYQDTCCLYSDFASLTPNWQASRSMHLSDSSRLLSTLSRLFSSALVAAGVADVSLAGFVESAAGIIITICGCFDDVSMPINSFHRFHNGCNRRAAGTSTGSDKTTTASGTTNSLSMSALTAKNMGILARNSVAMAATTDLTKPNLAVLPVFNRSVSMLLVNGDGQDTDVAEMVITETVIVVIISTYIIYLLYILYIHFSDILLRCIMCWDIILQLND